MAQPPSSDGSRPSWARRSIGGHSESRCGFCHVEQVFWRGCDARLRWGAKTQTSGSV